MVSIGLCHKVPVRFSRRCHKMPVKYVINCPWINLGFHMSSPSQTTRE